MKNFVVAAVLILAIVAESRLQAQYQIDDGTAEFAAGIPGLSFSWGNSFPVIPGAESLQNLEFGFGVEDTTGSLVGDVITWTVFSDTDLDPTNGGLVVLAQGEHVIQNDNFFANGVLDVIDVSSENIVVTDNFFVSANFNDAAGTAFPAVIDTSNPLASRSFFTIGEDPTQFIGGLSTETAGFAGNWIIRANGTAIPEPASIMIMLGLTAGLLVRRTR